MAEQAAKDTGSTRRRDARRTRVPADRGSSTGAGPPGQGRGQGSGRGIRATQTFSLLACPEMRRAHLLSRLSRLAAAQPVRGSSAALRFHDVPLTSLAAVRQLQRTPSALLPASARAVRPLASGTPALLTWWCLSPQFATAETANTPPPTQMKSMGGGHPSMRASQVAEWCVGGTTAGPGATARWPGATRAAHSLLAALLQRSRLCQLPSPPAGVHGGGA